VLVLSGADFRKFLQPLLPPDSVGRYTRVTTFLQRVPYLHTLDSRQLAAVSARMQFESAEAGAELVRQGEPGDRFYVISAGEASVWVANADGEKRLAARLGEGEFFGEVALIQRVPRTATVRAETRIDLLTLDKASFESLFQVDGSFRQRLEQFASRRVRQNRERGLDPSPLYATRTV
jgi:CRP-like cAMP-binding protein